MATGIAGPELRAQRVVTQAFINADSRPISLLRALRTDDGAGGYTTTTQNLSTQKMRLIPQQDGATQQTTADGQQVVPQYVLMGRWDADMQRGDTFVIDGQTYEVVFVNLNSQYERKGEVYFRG